MNITKEREQFSGHKCLIPEIDSFSELFTKSDEEKTIPFGVSSIGNTVSVSGNERLYNYGYFDPSEKLIKAVKENMLAIDYDRISFDIIVYNDMTALVVAHYSQILGSRWICLIDSETIPKSLERV